MSGLNWGRRFLMCAPQHFGVLYEINTWMSKQVLVDPDKAREQWAKLVSTLEAAGATIEQQPPVEGLPDLVFTANAGLVDGDRFIPARFRHPERQAESPYDIEWFEKAGSTIVELPEGVSHEGAGDALPFDGRLISGYRTRSDAAAHGHLSLITGAPVLAVELVDSRFYHLDLTFCPLDDRRAIVNPLGWDAYGNKVIESLVPEPLVLEPEEALGFVANSVVVGKNIVMPSCSPRVGRQLEAWGFEVAVTDVSEFLKAGGACRCLTLALDVTLSPVAEPRH
jgi:N-dimethylarginine dimethylaminohydrolase